ncbi:hypothetical protein K7711_36500 [Nocardia sp. CA2R105]|uniref:hypothetical protein n=1 Tax=Nocardia coffeae TaxID=2873381 RepID=UPI001CA68724|nr:hypothetical protein [Nocardia coffeae]MBY8862025.1 hypothetical protein [Nocardia coffeae]
MTELQPDPSAQWHAALLQRIAQLTAQHTRVVHAGYLGYDGTETDAREQWQADLDALTAQRERTEEVAVSAGVPWAQITQARFGATAGPPPPPERLGGPEQLAGMDTDRAFLLDMLSVDWWHLERLVLLTAAREIRLGGGLFGRDPSANNAAEHTMNLVHARIALLAAHAHLTPAESAELWGAQTTQRWRALAHVSVDTLDDLALEHTWRREVTAIADPAVPPYVDTATSNIPAAHKNTYSALPEPPRMLIDHAITALGAGAVESRFADTTSGPIVSAIDTMLPGGAARPWNPDPNLDHAGPAPREYDAGPEP